MPASKKAPTSPSAASRIQSTQAKAGHPVGKDSFASRSQSAAATNVNKGVVTGSAKEGAAKASGGKPSSKSKP
ncbi:hypothetical protein C8J56DRAFT_1046939 [Mycena floridula]|nr:hypothetical protein C8J56DRAFT_1046939 [Mycena floridula]